MNAPTNFPEVKRSYETFVHKKVSQSHDLIMAIPQGKRCFAWFTKNEKDIPVCYLMVLSRYKKGCPQTFENISKVDACFEAELSKGSILYGTTFHYQKKLFFAVEDILQYMGKDLRNLNNMEKMNTLSDIFNNNLKQLVYHDKFIVFGMPIMKKTIEEFISLPYKVSHYQYIAFSNNNKVNYINSNNNNSINNNSNNNNTNNTCLENTTFIVTETKQYEKPTTKQYDKNFEKNYKQQEKTGVFTVTPDIQNDIYYLGNGSTILNEIAYIPDYKTSVMMNRLFRNIKENQNLDALEESDDEDEFENDKPDKFVYLERSERMICAYNHKFKKWTPIRLE